MSTTIVAVVLAAAVLHALWNAMAKGGGTPELSIASYQTFGSLICLMIVPFIPLPAPESWPFIVTSVVLHNCYYLTLSMAYRSGDLSQVYPLLRGAAPILVALGAAVFAGERLSTGVLVGIVTISLGIMSLALFKTRFGHMSMQAKIWAASTALLIACYTVVDGSGVRVSGNAVSYITWLFVFECVPIGLFLLVWRRKQWMTQLTGDIRMNMAGAVASSLAYGLVIFAMTLGPMAIVSSLRETSVIFAAVIGWLWLREPFGQARVVAATMVAVGIVLIRVLA